MKRTFSVIISQHQHQQRQPQQQPLRAQVNIYSESNKKIFNVYSLQIFRNNIDNGYIDNKHNNHL